MCSADLAEHKVSPLCGLKKQPVPTGGYCLSIINNFAKKPIYSQAKTAADKRSGRLGYILIFQVSHDKLDAVVYACESKAVGAHYAAQQLVLIPTVIN